MSKESHSGQSDEPRGSVSQGAQPRFLLIGRVTKPHGVRGEMRVMPLTDRPERFSWLEEIYLGEEGTRSAAVTAARVHQGFVLLKLAGYDTREAAEALRGVALTIPAEQAIPLEEGEYYLRDLLGLRVVTEDGQPLGAITDVIETGANNVFVVRDEKRELLVPDIPDVIINLDFANGLVTVRPLPGLFAS